MLSNYDQPNFSRRKTRVPLLCTLIAALLLSGCLISTVSHLWQTRTQLKKFSEYMLFLPATETLGPGMRFLEPKLTTRDIRALASKREASRIDSLEDLVQWTYLWHRTPRQRRKAIHLTLDFRQDRLCELRVDKRFSTQLGDAMVEMLLRSFVGGKTQLSLAEKHIRCLVPADTLATHPMLGLDELRSLFGRENTRKPSPLSPTDSTLRKDKLLFRYRLAGTQGYKSKMSFGAVITRENEVLEKITSRIGGFRLEFDLSAHPDFPQ
jgi:hypothetical protein